MRQACTTRAGQVHIGCTSDMRQVCTMGTSARRDQPCGEDGGRRACPVGRVQRRRKRLCGANGPPVGAPARVVAGSQHARTQRITVAHAHHFGTECPQPQKVHDSGTNSESTAAPAPAPSSACRRRGRTSDAPCRCAVRLRGHRIWPLLAGRRACSSGGS